ncbi:ATP-binding response regulator [Rivibacter subsaxonicus]|uniref:histidine kinase n=1 Tax=Rivibacter subsaxonicus TaxID=457575 RepID=A0A4Q7VWF0_9BURK|nr:HAMP domain-containing sensor histidine kinase [Rivibacter subsaxonicus]RZU01031.1 signal transduction histidine kinase [Rivibacter subsaxonicus]
MSLIVPPMPAPAPAADEIALQTPRQALLTHLARQSPVVAAPIFLSALAIAAVASREVPRGWALGWLVLVCLVLALRSVVLPRLARPGPASEATRMRVALAMSVVNGLVLGSAVVFAPWLHTVELAVVTIVLMFVSAGVVSTNLGYRPMLLAYLVPSVGSLVLVWALVGPAGSTPEMRGLGIVVAILVGLFALSLLAMGRRAWQQHVQAIAARHEQQRLTRELGAALARAEAANRAKTHFLAAASHDLRQPMHTLSLFGAALLMRPLDERSREIAQHMDGALRVLGSQLDALLDVSRLDAGVVRAESLNFALGDFVQRLCRDMQPVARARGLGLELDIEGGQHVCTDPLLLERIVRNLIDNALKYTERGQVTVRLRPIGERLELSIADTGRGIPEHEQARVFEEFYQLGNPGRDRERGLGLGLSIVRRLADLLGIELALKSIFGSGTTVTLQLPVVAAAEAAPRPAPPSAEALRGCRVLVIDDELTVRSGMHALLESHGCVVSLAADGAEALAAAHRSQPDIVLADLRLQDDESGIDCIHRLRQLWPDLPALLISGDIAPARLRQAHDTNLRLLHKPVDADLLRAAMVDALDA